MIVAPISTYFLTVNNVFKGKSIIRHPIPKREVPPVFSPSFREIELRQFLGNSTWAGASAAIMANVVLIGYIVAAVYEDQGEPAPPPLKGKKGE